MSDVDRAPRPTGPSALMRGLISAFIAINLGTVLFMNRPDWLIEHWNELRDRWLPGQSGQLFRLGESRVRQYAHLTGLDRFWDMFSRLAPMDWRFVFEAEYLDGSVVRLPIERQTERTFCQRHFFDFKEMKYHQNLYPEGAATHRQAYLNYLARRFPEHDGSPLWKLRVNMHLRPILDPYEAARAGHHLGEEEIIPFDEYPERDRR